MQRVVLVTDPMCSWCWGMTAEFERARQTNRNRVTFDLLLGGINTHGTQPIGDYGRRFLFKLWREVADTTGQTFGFVLPDAYVHNSTLPCVAVQAVRQISSEVPFDYLHELQRRFFATGEDITDRGLLTDAAVQFGIDRDEFRGAIEASITLESVRFQFDNARSFGTQALPSLLLEVDGKLQLLAGGFIDAEMLGTLLDARSVPSDAGAET